MADDKMFCAGVTDDGTTCEEYYWRPGTPPDIPPYWETDNRARRMPRGVTFGCWRCGTLLGVTKDCKPTREWQVPKAALPRARRMDADPTEDLATQEAEEDRDLY